MSWLVVRSQQDVVVDGGRDRGKVVGHSGEACGEGRRCVHESLMSVSSIALNVHASDTWAIATATMTAADGQASTPLATERLPSSNILPHYPKRREPRANATTLMPRPTTQSKCKVRRDVSQS